MCCRIRTTTLVTTKQHDQNGTYQLPQRYCHAKIPCRGQNINRMISHHNKQEYICLTQGPVAVQRPLQSHTTSMGPRHYNRQVFSRTNKNFGNGVLEECQPSTKPEEVLQRRLQGQSGPNSFQQYGCNFIEVCLLIIVFEAPRVLLFETITRELCALKEFVRTL